MFRALFVRRMATAHIPDVTALFDAHDRTRLPGAIGVTRRTLFHFHDLYFHLVEADRDMVANVRTHRDDPRLRMLDSGLARYLAPYEASAPTMGDSQARVFYSWSPTATAAPAGFRKILRFDVARDQRAGFERAWDAMGAAARAHPANLDQCLAYDAEIGCYLLITDWVDEEGYLDFQRSDAHRNAGPELKQYLRAVARPDIVRRVAPLPMPLAPAETA
ncbi:TcmI family type II polyketide cyclase [Nocardia sp. NPDC056100]|uniref:TcmI family type II polyketide cyclase n=1 Tax=Nocardia sp. NPDC056100 TaxID=3345712 RepID=UPI0035DEF437